MSLRKSKESLTQKLRIKKQELLLKQEIAALEEQLLGVNTSIPVPSTEAVHSPSPHELDTATTGARTPMQVPLHTEAQTPQ